MKNNYMTLLAASLCASVAGCGGGTSTSDNGQSASTPAPAIVDNVLMSSGSAANGLVVSINHDGYIRAFGTGTDQPLTIGLGTTPVTGNLGSATGNGWLPSGSTFVQGSATLSANSDAQTYTLKVQGGNIAGSESTLSLTGNLVKPTVASLAGTYGLSAYQPVVISGTSISGGYTLYCTWSATLTPQTNTIDVTSIQFQSLPQQTGVPFIPCPYVGKTFTGTAFLLGPSAAYPKGVFVMNWDDGGSTMPTTIGEQYFPRQ